VAVIEKRCPDVLVIDGAGPLREVLRFSLDSLPTCQFGMHEKITDCADDYPGSCR
jgi:hypothetical protein